MSSNELAVMNGDMRIAASGYQTLLSDKYDITRRQSYKYSPDYNKRAQDGWRFVCIVPTTQRGTGHIEEMDQVFEKQF